MAEHKFTKFMVLALLIISFTIHNLVDASALPETPSDQKLFIDEVRDFLDTDGDKLRRRNPVESNGVFTTSWNATDPDGTTNVYNIEAQLSGCGGVNRSSVAGTYTLSNGTVLDDATAGDILDDLTAMKKQALGLHDLGRHVVARLQEVQKVSRSILDGGLVCENSSTTETQSQQSDEIIHDELRHLLWDTQSVASKVITGAIIIGGNGIAGGISAAFAYLTGKHVFKDRDVPFGYAKTILLFYCKQFNVTTVPRAEVMDRLNNAQSYEELGPDSNALFLFSYSPADTFVDFNSTSVRSLDPIDYAQLLNYWQQYLQYSQAIWARDTETNYQTLAAGIATFLGGMAATLILKFGEHPRVDRLSAFLLSLLSAAALKVLGRPQPTVAAIPQLSSSASSSLSSSTSTSSSTKSSTTTTAVAALATGTSQGPQTCIASDKVAQRAFDPMMISPDIRINMGTDFGNKAPAWNMFMPNSAMFSC